MALTDQQVIDTCIEKLIENASGRGLMIPSVSSTPQATDYVTNMLRLPLALMTLAGLSIEEYGSNALPNHASTHATGGDDPITPSSIGAAAVNDPRFDELAADIADIIANPPALANHASTHKHGGSDEVGTYTPATGAIPKAGVGGKLSTDWLPTATTSEQGIARAATDAEIIAGTATTPPVIMTPAQAKLAVTTHAPGGGSGIAVSTNLNVVDVTTADETTLATLVIPAGAMAANGASASWELDGVWRNGETGTRQVRLQVKVGGVAIINDVTFTLSATSVKRGFAFNGSIIRATATTARARAWGAFSTNVTPTVGVGTFGNTTNWGTLFGPALTDETADPTVDWSVEQTVTITATLVGTLGALFWLKKTFVRFLRFGAS